MQKKLLRLPAVLELIPVSKTVWYQGIKSGEYPKPIKVGRASMWLESEIMELIDHMANSQRSV